MEEIKGGAGVTTNGVNVPGVERAGPGCGVGEGRWTGTEVVM